MTEKKDLGELFLYIYRWLQDWEPEGKQAIKIKFVNQGGGAMELEQNRKQFEDALKKTNERHSGALKKLADS